MAVARGRLARVDARSSDSEFEEAMQGLSHVTDALQEGIMKTRMQPMTVAWGWTKAVGWMRGSSPPSA